jgi:hypothetical protein
VKLKLLVTGVVGNSGKARVMESVLKILICPNIVTVAVEFLVAYLNC